MLRSEGLCGLRAMLHPVAASNNRDHLTRSLCYCLLAPHIMGVTLRTHSVRGESHIQRHGNWEVVTTNLFFTTNLTDHTFFLWRAWPSHPGHSTILLQWEDLSIKQQLRLPNKITLLLLVCATYIWVLFFAHIPFVKTELFGSGCFSHGTS